MRYADEVQRFAGLKALKAEGGRTVSAAAALQRRHNISPVEVKGSGEYATKSLDKFSGKYAPHLGEKFVVHVKNLERRGGRTHIPFYMLGML